MRIPLRLAASIRNPLRFVATGGALLFILLALGVSALPAGADGGNNGNSQGQGNQEMFKGAQSQEHCQTGQFPKEQFQTGQFHKGRFENAQGDQGNSDWGKAQEGQGQGCGQITLTKHVASREKPSDSFEIFVVRLPMKVLAQASTGTGNSATAGPISVHPGSYILGEKAGSGSGTDLSKYQISWSCTDNGKSVKAMPFTDGNKIGMIKVNVRFGEDIACTVTNQVPAVSVPFTTPEAGAGLAGVAGLLGLGWVVARRRRRLAA
jgi:hypothetical protein